MENNNVRTPVKQQDFLEQDPAIRGQQYVCLSFISPENVIQKKDLWMFNRFLTHFSSDLKELFTNLHARFEGHVHIQDMIKNIHERYEYIDDNAALQNEFDFFMSTNQSSLESEYLEQNQFQTTVRGLKVRGVYEALAEAQNRAQTIRKFDPNFDVYVAEVGCWCPWNPIPSEVADQEFAETELNTLVKKYKENQKSNELHYEERKKLMVDKNKENTNIQVVEDNEEIIDSVAES